jgi:arginine/ornithine N-succinyltransferase beta subunit
VRLAAARNRQTRPVVRAVFRDLLAVARSVGRGLEESPDMEYVLAAIMLLAIVRWHVRKIKAAFRR